MNNRDGYRDTCSRYWSREEETNGPVNMREYRLMLVMSGKSSPVGRQLSICLYAGGAGGDAFGLAQERGGDVHPPGRGAEVGLHAEDLKNEEQRKGVEIDLVDATVDDEVAEDAEKDQCVDAAG